MVEPTGYTALDIIGFTDKGPYDPTANYVKNDLVHVGNSTWRCKIDDTTGITPTEGANWTIFIESATSLAGMSDVDLNNPTDNDGLVYDATAQKWKNKSVVTGDLWAQNGAHNLLPFPYNSGGTQVISSFTLTVNDSGVDKGKMSASGTANESNRFNLYVGKLPKNNYKFRFVGSLSGVEVAIYDYVTEHVIGNAGANEDITLTVDATNENHNFLLYIYWSSGSISISGRPLLKLASDPSNIDTSYAKTNLELTENEPQISLNGNGSTYILKTVIIDDVCIFALKVKKTAASWTICTCPLPLADEEIVGRVNINGTTADVVVLHDTNQGALQVRSEAIDSNWRYVSGVYRIA